MKKITDKESVARCAPIGMQRATIQNVHAAVSCNRDATKSLKALALQGLERNKSCNEHATGTEEPCNDHATNVALDSNHEDLISWYLLNKDRLDLNEDLFGYRNSKLSGPVELVELILKEPADYWMRTNGDLEHCLCIIKRHTQYKDN